LANGWGWVIEDLSINLLVDAVEEMRYNQTLVYPNPGNGIIKINGDVSDNLTLKPYRYSVINSSGSVVLSGNASGDPETVIDISDFPAGFYIILLNSNEGLRRIKYILIK